MISDRTKKFIDKLKIKLRITYLCRRCNPRIRIWCRLGKVICYVLTPNTIYTKITDIKEKVTDDK